MLSALLLAFATASVANEALRLELLEMRAEDQAARLAEPRDFDAIRAIDARNTARLKEIVSEHGWPKTSLVGADGSSAAWLLAQHADADREFQRTVLSLIAPLVAASEVSGSDFAYLWDRVNEPQRFGTQGRCESGNFVPREIEAPEEVDALRASVGLGPLQEYIDFASTRLCDR